MAAYTYVGNMSLDPDGSKGPLLMPGLVAAATVLDMGEIVELSGNSNTEWVALDSDYDMAAGSPADPVAVAWQDKSATDRLGYYKLAIPRPGDLWRYTLAAAGATAIGAALYYSADKVLATSGTYIIGNSAGYDHYPDFQGRVTLDAGPDAGTTIRNQTSVIMTFQRSVSYYAQFQTD